MNMPWDPQQREWLQALGHDVLMLASNEGSREIPLAGPSEPAAAHRGAVASGPSESPLMRAVLRAAGRREAGELAAWLPDTAALRGDAAAKRALWPRLRALRRNARDA
jgi:hypothetical protein